MLAPDMVQLDMTGPFEVLARVPGWSVSLVAATLDPVRTDRGLRIVPDTTRESAAVADLLVVPGGAGVDSAMLDTAWIDFVRRQADSAEHVFGICTGSLLLGAAGLLQGRRAGGHWQARDLLTRFGAIPSDARVTVDGKYYTSGGVTSGIDVALRVVADLEGEVAARKIQLAIEYDPHPPFPGGTPSTSPAEVVRAVQADARARRAQREDMVAQAAERLRQP
ncbi:DJ-1/PfpI family protein [Pseudoroseomonas globiformis]|uniref:DJ-1/PfpI family protein n=1 Tax=Teichococcus globiformis TaxID=2307229 RepID=A0ABV7G7A4_9PROT